MSNGDDNQDDTSGQADTGGRKSRRRQAVRPPVIEGEAQEVTEASSEETAETESTATEETAEESSTAEPAAVSETPSEPSEAESETEAVEAQAETESEASGDVSEETESDSEEEAPEEEGETEAAAPEDVKPEQTPEPALLPTARRASVIAAGLVGAVLALALYIGLDYADVLPKTSASNSELSNMIEDLPSIA
jgi:hypothetical protein